MILCVRYAWWEKSFFVKQVNNRNVNPRKFFGDFLCDRSVPKHNFFLLYETFLKSAASNVCKENKKHALS